MGLFNQIKNKLIFFPKLFERQTSLNRKINLIFDQFPIVEKVRRTRDEFGERIFKLVLRDFAETHPER